MNTIDEDFKIIEEFEEEIKFYVNSDLRLEILTNMYAKPSTLKMLHTNTGLNYTSISANVLKMESNNILDRKKEYYYLKNQAKFKLLTILLLENNLEFLTEFESYLNNHIVKEDRLESLSILPYVENAKLVQAGNINPDIVMDMIHENMLSQGAVKAICTYLHPNFEELMKYLMETSSDFEAIVPLAVAKNIITHAMKFKKDLPFKNKYFNVNPVLDENLRILLVVSHERVVLGLTWFTEIFNKNCVLVSDESLVIDWAYTLFTEYDYLASKYLSIREIIIKNNNLKE